MNSMAYMSPDWVLLGVQADDKFHVYASDELNMAELEAVVRQPWEELGYPYEPIERSHLKHIRLGAELRRFTVTIGDSYADALSKLMNTWHPPETKRKKLPEGQRALDEASKR